MRKRIQSLLAVTLTLFLLVLSGCGQTAPENQNPPENPPEEAAEEVPDAESAENAAADDPLSFSDAKRTDLSVTVDGEPLTVAMYEDCYVTNPTTVAMIPACKSGANRGERREFYPMGS